MFLFAFLMTLWSNKIIDHNVLHTNVCNTNVCNTNVCNTNVCNTIDPKNIFNSVILCNDIQFQMIEYLKQNNTIYIPRIALNGGAMAPLDSNYLDTKSSQYNYNFLLVLLSAMYNMPILTTKQNYFKPFQYSIYDIKLLQLKSKLKKNSSIDFLLMDYLSINYLFLEKNNKQFFVDNNNANLFIKV